MGERIPVAFSISFLNSSLYGPFLGCPIRGRNIMVTAKETQC